MRSVDALRPGSYASMSTLPGQLGRSVTWDGGQVFGGAFGVDWECKCDLPFSSFAHLRNPLNENKPIGICRDGTEVPRGLGEVGGRTDGRMVVLCVSHSPVTLLADVELGEGIWSRARKGTCGLVDEADT